MFSLCTTLIHKVKFLISRLKLDRREAQATGRPRIIPKAEAITYGLLQHVANIATKKRTQEVVEAKGHYSTFVRAINRHAKDVSIILALLLKANREDAHLVKITDATDIPVCLAKNAKHHRTMAGFADWGKTGKGWFYGLKLHLTTDVKRRILALKFTAGNTHDSQVAIKLNQGLKGIFLADAAYTGAKLAQEFHEQTGGFLFAKPRKNMRTLANWWWDELYRFRMRIEWSFRSLKLFYGLVSSVPRSVNGYLANYVYALVGYLLA